MRFRIVADKSGNIIAAAEAHDGVRDVREYQTGFYALPGQTIVELDAPAALSRMEPHDRLRAIFTHRVSADGRRLEPVARKRKDDAYGV